VGGLLLIADEDTKDAREMHIGVRGLMEGQAWSGVTFENVGLVHSLTSDVSA
jgi:hypothetical protein